MAAKAVDVDITLLQLNYVGYLANNDTVITA